VPVGDLTVGDTVLDPVGDRVEVIWAQEYPSRREQLVKLTTLKNELKVTAHHRVPVRDLQWKYAKDFKRHDWILAGREQVQLTDVEHSEEAIRVVELGFEDDALVEAWPLPIGCGIVVKGQLAEQTPVALLQCKLEHDDDNSRSSTGSANPGSCLRVEDDRVASSQREAMRSQTVQDRPMPGEKLRLLTFSRSPHALEDVLLHGDELRSCRDALSQVDRDVKLSSGAKVFVPPHLWAYVDNLLRFNRLDLKACHVICSSDLQHLVMQAVGRIRSRDRVECKKITELLLCGDAVGEKLSVRRTFIDFSEQQDLTQMRGSKSAPPMTSR